MYKIEIITIGKNKELWLKQALLEYEKRLEKSISLKWVLAKDNPHLINICNSIDFFICLSPNGKILTSETFSTMLFKWLEKNGSRLTFVIGGAEGIPTIIQKKSSYNLSLSFLTFTHQITRILLIEQIYRAEQIYKNTPYHN
jgi:23S rRNA (pseudouridine1915-N3)-methyltransferase